MIRPSDRLRRRDNPRTRSNSAGRRFRPELHAVDEVERDGLVRGARDCPGQRLARIREDLGIVPGAAQRDVELLAIDQFAASPDVDGDENDPGTLADTRGNRITVIQMRERLQVHLRFPLMAQPERGDSGSRFERSDGTELAVVDAEFAVRQAELDAFALREDSAFLAKNLHAL
jgi:hypothetical protein